MSSDQNLGVQLPNKIIDKVRESGPKEGKDYFFFHQNRFEHLFELLDKQKETKNSVLGVGCGFLHTLIGAYYLGYRDLFGIDIEINKDFLSKTIQKFNFILKPCDLAKDKIPFKNSFFNLALLTETLEHFNFHPREAINEIYRVLKPRGHLIITTPNLFRLNNQIKFCLQRSIYDDLKKEKIVHYREYSSKEIRYLLEEAGFSNIKINYADFNYPDANWFNKLINKVFGFFFPALRPNIVVVATK
jgi:SAM-dependent methyltransferase